MLTWRILLPFIATAALAAPAAETPRTFTLRGDALLASRARIAAGEPATIQALGLLRAEADELLALRPASVMDKPRIAASGDRHDYFSQAPYWWPDPAKPDGLPYLRDDGRLNPASKTGTDSAAFGRTCRAVGTLGLAYWFTADERYARQAARLTRTWFLDAATRMNPHLEHAQAIPGINEGRGIGIIEARHLIGLLDGLALLAGSPAWTGADAAAMNGWLSAYYRWLTTSQHGRDESKAAGVYAGNNHGSWYDAQVVALALALGRMDDAKKILAAVPGERIARQIEPDGRQPLELARTKSLNYSLLNLEALVLLARFGEAAGIDLWSFSTPDGRSLPGALNYVAPYADPAKVWPQPDLEPADRARLFPLLAEALRHREDARLRDLLARFGRKPAAGEYWRLESSPAP